MPRKRGTRGFFKKITTHNLYKLAVPFVCGFLIALLAHNVIAPQTQITPLPDPEIKVVWPRENINLFDNQVFIIDLLNFDLDNTETKVFWSLEDGVKTGVMESAGSYQYQAEVNVSDWDWKKNNQYFLTFWAEDEAGFRLVQDSIAVFVADGNIEAEAVEDETESTGVTADSKVEESPETAISKPVPTPIQTPVVAKQEIEKNGFGVEWIKNDSQNNQKFIYHIDGYDTDSITAFWNTDGGHKNIIFKKGNEDNFTTDINMFGWRWLDKGPYKISFSIADKETSKELATQNFDVFWEGTPGSSDLTVVKTGETSAPEQPKVEEDTRKEVRIQVVSNPEPAKEVVPEPEPEPEPETPNLNIRNLSTNSLINSNLYKPEKPAVQNALNSTNNNEVKEALQYILSQPNSIWLNGDGYDSDEYIQSVLAEAKSTRKVPAFVLYNIPNRDCGSHSSGGTASVADYKAWVDRIASNLRNAEAIVIVEPDALPQLNCLKESERNNRLEMLKYAVEKTAATSKNTMVYIDAGHPYWVDTNEIAQRLKLAGVEKARGFALNVSNYISTNDNIVYGNIISNLLGGKKYVIDSSRSGNSASPTREWCNPAGRALGESPSLSSRGALDGVLWIKFPGESDGHCNGGPGAGQWWTEYAVDLYKNR